MNAITPVSPGTTKRLALFLDGTWNTVSNNTNVWRLKSLCARSGADGKSQLIYYNLGLGTTIGEHLRGGIFGYGLDDVVIDAYEWLIDNYDSGDEIFIFGFSRGAYTARSLSGFISRCGLASPGAPLSINQLYERYKKGNDVQSIYELNEDPQSASENEEKWMLKYSRPTQVKFTGVWETVGALSTSNNFTWFTGGNHDFLDVNLRRSEEFAFHALAIDEHRKAFAPTLFTRFAPKIGNDPVAPRPLSQVEQRWFLGEHGNVGGGLDNDLLAQIPLKWLMGKAASLGLGLRQNVDLDNDAYQGQIGDSFSDFLDGAYKAIELGIPYYREIGQAPQERTETIVHTINETIDVSVFNRWRSDTTYRPKNLDDWAKSCGVKIEDLDLSVRADNPTVIIPD